MATETALARSNGSALSEAAARLIYRDRSGNALNPVQIELIVALCQKHGLVPELQHITLISDRAYITNAGLLHKAHEMADLSGIETRPATAEERIAYLLSTEDTRTHVWRAFVRRRAFSGKEEAVYTYEGWGKASSNESGAARNNPQEMAATRAVNRALRLAYDVGMTSLEEMPAAPADQGDDAEFGQHGHDEPPGDWGDTRANGKRAPTRTVNGTTGEIIERAAPVHSTAGQPATSTTAPAVAGIGPERAGRLRVAAIEALKAQGYTDAEALQWVTGRLERLQRPGLDALTEAEARALLNSAKAAAPAAEPAVR